MSKNFDWTQERISFLSDVIVSAAVIKTDRLEENVGTHTEDQAGHSGGVEVTFLVIQTFKGTVPLNGHVVVRQHHAPEVTILSSSLEAHHGKSYLLYLRFGNDADPVADLRLDPAGSSGRLGDWYNWP